VLGLAFLPCTDVCCEGEEEEEEEKIALRKRRKGVDGEGERRI